MDFLGHYHGNWLRPTPNAFIADPGTDEDDGTITIIVRQDVYEVRMPARDFCRRYPIERPGQEVTEREAC